MSPVEKSRGEQAQELKAVVSLLDEEHTRKVCHLWDELEVRFGVEATFRTPVPHFSYQVANDYEMERLRRVLSDATHDQPPLSVTTSGLGVFTGPHPTLYVPVIRTSALSSFHERLYPRLAEIAQEIRPYFTPRYWAPHITLALAEISPQTIAEILQHFSRRDFTWEITVDNVAVICDMCGEEGVQMRFDFGGAVHHTNLSE
jgi:2'-5' RNA ligase